MQNSAMFQFFQWYYPEENHLWQEVAREAPHLSYLGIGGVWLPPAYKAASGHHSVGYDPYDLYDLGEFDQKGGITTKYGSKKEYIRAIKALHKNGIQAYADIVLNHKAGADEMEVCTAFKVDPTNRNKRISEPYQIKAPTKFTFPGRGNKYSSFKWDFHCFTGVDWDDYKHEKGIYKIINEYGKDWEKLLGNELGNFDFLVFSDVEFRNPALRDELKKWGLWYLNSTGVDGFRLDAIKHISPSFYPDWLRYLRYKSGKELFTVGEYFSSLDLILKFQKITKGCMSLFDFPLHGNLHTASEQGQDFDLRKIFENTLVASDPVHAVTFVDNHDTQPLRITESCIKDWFKPHAYALILLREQGYPCVFYPDLYGASYKDKGRDGKDYEIAYQPCAGIAKLLLARKCHAFGAQRDYFDSPNVIGWTREGTSAFPSGCAVLLSNKEEGKIEMEIGKIHAGKVFHELMETRQDEIAINEEGRGVFSVNAGAIAVWIPE